MGKLTSIGFLFLASISICDISSMDEKKLNEEPKNVKYHSNFMSGGLPRALGESPSPDSLNGIASGQLGLFCRDGKLYGKTYGCLEMLIEVDKTTEKATRDGLAPAIYGRLEEYALSDKVNIRALQPSLLFERKPLGDYHLQDAFSQTKPEDIEALREYIELKGYISKPTQAFIKDTIKKNPIQEKMKISAMLKEEGKDEGDALFPSVPEDIDWEEIRDYVYNPCNYKKQISNIEYSGMDIENKNLDYSQLLRPSHMFNYEEGISGVENLDDLKDGFEELKIIEKLLNPNYLKSDFEEFKIIENFSSKENMINRDSSVSLKRKEPYDTNSNTEYVDMNIGQSTNVDQSQSKKQKI